MTGEVGALGELATGALIARSFDGAPEPSDSASHGDCRNCGAPLHGHFCSHCGQHAVIHRSVAHIAEEVLHGITHFDSKTWRTLPALVFRPGGLTRDYVYGKRARYIAPMALFLFTVFLMFFVFGLLGGPDIDKALNGVNDGPEAVADAREAVADMRDGIVDTQGELADPDTSGVQRQALTTALAAQRLALAAAERKLAAPRTATPQVVANAARWQDRLAALVRSGELHIGGPPAITARVREALLNPDFALYRIQEKAYKQSFLLVPLSFPVLWLLFAGRREVRAFDHIVFALYSLSFMSLLIIVFALLEHVGNSVALGSRIAGLLLFVPPVHMFFQLKGAYQLGIGGALWRTAVLAVSTLVTLSLFAAVIVLVGLAD